MKIGYSATFNNPNSLMPFEKHWIEEDELLHGLNLFDVTDEQIEQLTKNIRRIQYAIRKQVKDFYYESTNADKKQLAEVKKEEPQSVEAKIIAQINGCGTVKVLESFKLLSQNNHNIKGAYEQKFAELNGTL